MAIFGKVAYKVEKNTAFGNPIAVSTGTMLKNVRLNMSDGQDFERIRAVNLSGGILKKTASQITGSIQTRMNYGLTELFYAAGTSHRTLSPAAVTAGVYRHIIQTDCELQDRPIGLFENTATGNLYRRGTLAVDKIARVWEYFGVYVNGFEIEIAPGAMSATFSVIAAGVVVPGATNTSSSGWTLPAGSDVKFADTEIYIKPRDIFDFSTSREFAVTDSGGTDAAVLTTVISAGEVAKLIEKQLNASGTLNGVYSCTYDSENRRFRLFCDETVTVSTGNANEYLGFESGQAGNSISSKYLITPVDAAAFTSSDRFGATRMSVSLNNGLQTQQERGKYGLKNRVYGGLQQVSGTIEIDRYSTSDNTDGLAEQFVENDAFSVYIVSTGEIIRNGVAEKFEIFMPSVKFRRVSVPTSENKYPTISISFEAMQPEAFEYRRDYIDGFHNRTTSLGVSVTALGFFDRTLYAGYGTTTGSIARTSLYSNSTSLGSVSGSLALCFGTYNNLLWIGFEDGKVAYYSGGTVTVSTSGLSGDVVDMINFDGKLWVITTTGQVSYFDKSTWTTVTTLAGTGYALQIYNGVLFAASGTAVFAYNGSSFASSSTGFSAPMDLQIFDGALYASGGSTLRRRRGSSWSNMTSPGVTVKYMCSWLNRLVLFENNNDSVFTYNTRTGETQEITSAGDPIINRPVVYRGLLVYPVDGAVRIVSPPANLTIAITNETSNNPL